MRKDVVGTYVSRLVGELDKLVLLSGNGNAITPEVVERNIGISKDFNNFEHETPISNREADKAFQIV